MIHISFYTKEEKFQINDSGLYYSTGKSYETTDPLEAIKMWKEEYPNAEFINAKLN